MVSNAAGQLDATRDFWDASPCDGQSDFAQRAAYRYGKEPWLLALINQLARDHSHIVEIGCGQGTDALTFCQRLPEGGSYLGLDYSPKSVAAAEAALDEVRGQLAVVPAFRVANAEALDLEGNSIECVFSCGVLHHTPNTERAIAEIHRVLQPGGRAYVMLYRLWSARLLAAHSLRGLGALADRVSGGDRVFYRAMLGHHHEEQFGTAILECLGVPVLRSYTEAGMRRLFSAFQIDRLTPVGYSLLRRNRVEANLAEDGRHPNVLGSYYLIEVTKLPTSANPPH